MQSTQNCSAEELSDRLVSIEEGARLLKQKPQTLHNWLSMKKHGLKRVKLGNRTYLDKCQIEKILLEAMEG